MEAWLNGKLMLAVLLEILHAKLAPSLFFVGAGKTGRSTRRELSFIMMTVRNNLLPLQDVIDGFAQLKKG